MWRALGVDSACDAEVVQDGDRSGCVAAPVILEGPTPLPEGGFGVDCRRRHGIDRVESGPEIMPDVREIVGERPHYRIRRGRVHRDRIEDLPIEVVGQSLGNGSPDGVPLIVFNGSRPFRTIAGRRIRKLQRQLIQAKEVRETFPCEDPRIVSGGRGFDQRTVFAGRQGEFEGLHWHMVPCEG